MAGRTLDEAVDAIRSAGGFAMAVVCDVRDENSVSDAVRVAVGEDGRASISQSTVLDAVPGRCRLVGLDARHAAPHSRIAQDLIFPPEQPRRRYVGSRSNIGDCVGLSLVPLSSGSSFDARSEVGS